MNVQTIWLRVLRDGVALDLIVDVPVVGADGPQRLGHLAVPAQPRPLPRPQRQGEGGSVSRRDSSETFQ